MSQLEAAQIENFMHQQVACWNRNDREGFFEAYRSVAPDKLTIEYVGNPPADGWQILEKMWEQQNAKIDIEEAALIITGNEAVCHNRNKVKGTDMVLDTIEHYQFGDTGSVTVRYFIKQP